MAKTATLSTVIDANVKKAINALCKRKGYKLKFFVEKALIRLLNNENTIKDDDIENTTEDISQKDSLAERKKI